MKSPELPELSRRARRNLAAFALFVSVPVAAYEFMQVQERGGIPALFRATGSDVQTVTDNGSPWNKSHISPSSSPTSTEITSAPTENPDQTSELIKTDIDAIIFVVASLAGGIATYELVGQTSSGLNRRRQANQAHREYEARQAEISALDQQFAKPAFEKPHY